MIIIASTIGYVQRYMLRRPKGYELDEVILEGRRFEVILAERQHIQQLAS